MELLEVHASARVQFNCSYDFGKTGKRLMEGLSTIIDSVLTETLRARMVDNNVSQSGRALVTSLFT